MLIKFKSNNIAEEKQTKMKSLKFTWSVQLSTRRLLKPWRLPIVI